MLFNLRFATALLVGLAITSAQSRAADILSNIPQTNDSSQGTIGNNFLRTVAFTMGAQAYSLDSVVLRLSGYDSAAGDVPQIEIRNDTGGTTPGNTVLASFTNPVSQGSGRFNYTFTPSAPFTLSASTKYWLYVNVSSGLLGWMGSSPALTPTGVATPNGALGFNGTSWSSVGYNSFTITGTVVPEPSTVILAGLSVAAIAATSLRRRRKA